MVDGKPGIYAASGYSSWLYAKEVKGWRDAKIFEARRHGRRATIERRPASSPSCATARSGRAPSRGRPIERFDEEKVKDALRALKSLAADDFGDGKTAEETGLDAPGRRPRSR